MTPSKYLQLNISAYNKYNNMNVYMYVHTVYIMHAHDIHNICKHECKEWREKLQFAKWKYSERTKDVWCD